MERYRCGNRKSRHREEKQSREGELVGCGGKSGGGGSGGGTLGVGGGREWGGAERRWEEN